MMITACAIFWSTVWSFEWSKGIWHFEKQWDPYNGQRTRDAWKHGEIFL